MRYVQSTCGTYSRLKEWAENDSEGSKLDAGRAPSVMDLYSGCSVAEDVVPDHPAGPVITDLNSGHLTIPDGVVLHQGVATSRDEHTQVTCATQVGDASRWELVL